MKNYRRPLDFKNGCVDMLYGSGGRAMSQLIDELFRKTFDNPLLNQQNDQAQFDVPDPEINRLVMSTDGHVISPLFFPGGDIGSLSVHGTLNDVAMCGAKPLYLSAGFILEEGFPLSSLRRIVLSMGEAAKSAGVPIITGDTKVVERGCGDGVFITTTGIGVVSKELSISGDQARPGDKVIISGNIGEHGIAIMSLRENLSFTTTIESDTANLYPLVETMVKSFPSIHCMRDPTRGGVGNVLNELATQSGVGIMLNEQTLPIRTEVKSACELLGLDPLYVANEGILVVICPADIVEGLIELMQQHTLGRNAAIIGEVLEDEHQFVEMQTAVGGKRIVDWLTGEQLPRIC